MNTSVIRYRVADFLKRYPPFDDLPEQELLDLAGAGRVKFQESDELVYELHGRAKGQVWAIQQGVVELRGEGDALLDVLVEGDLLGVECLLGNDRYLSTARTASDVLLYSIAAPAFEAAIARHPAARRYIAAHFAAPDDGGGRRSWLDAEAPPLDFVRARTAAGAKCAAEAGAGATTRELVRVMVRSREEAVRLSADAVLRAGDLALFCGHDPARLLREIREARSAVEIGTLARLGAKMAREALARPRDAGDSCLLATEVTAAAAEACLWLAQDELEQAGLEAPGVPHCWVAFGVMARGELLAPAFPHVAAIYECGEAAAYFVAVAGAMSSWMHACGLDGPGLAWPEGAHPAMPLAEWKRFYSATIHDTLSHDLYARREFFDRRLLSGDARLAAELDAHVAAELERESAFLTLLANDTLSHSPPITFFRGVVKGMDVIERDDLDLAKSAIQPVSDAARVIGLKQRNSACSSTLERLGECDAAEAFRVALFHHAKAGGAPVNPRALPRYDQRVLKTAFRAIVKLLEHTAAL